MKKVSKIITISLLMIGLVFITSCPSFAQRPILEGVRVIVVGEKVEFNPPNPKVGELVDINVHFRVEDDISGTVYSPIWSIQITSPPLPPPPITTSPPTIRRGSNVVKLEWIVPERFIGGGKVCFNIVEGKKVLIKNVCLEFNTLGEAISVSRGTGYRIAAMAGREREPSPSTPPPSPPPPRVVKTDPTGPDLRVYGTSFRIKKTYATPLPVYLLGGRMLAFAKSWVEIKIQNIGRSKAEQVRTHIEYEIEGRWVPVMELETIPRLDPGKTKTFKIDSYVPDGATKMRVSVDPFDQIIEADESNNVVYRPVPGTK